MSVSTSLSGGYRRERLCVVKMYWADIAPQHRRGVRRRRSGQVGGGRLQPRGLAEEVGLVGLLPGEVRVVAAEVAVGGGLLVDGAVELQVVAKRAGAQVEVLCDQLQDPGPADLLRAERLHHDRNRMGDSDRVGDLELGPLGQAGGGE